MEYINTMESNRDVAVTIGNFDGLHKGHRDLIHRVKSCALRKGLASLVFSFAPHPEAVFGRKPFYSILSKQEKIFLLESMDVDIFLEYPFDEDFSRIDPACFMELLFSKLRCKVLVVGEGYCFGKDRAGTAALLKDTGERRGVTVDIAPHVYDEEENIKVSSSRIRELILTGDMKKTEGLLSRPYFIMGEIMSGRRIGRKLGFPTVNLIPPTAKILPPNGVYATKVFYENKLWPGVTNVGINPTVGGGIKTVETYIFDFEREIYGEQVRVDFYEKIRSEKKFEGVGALRAQIASDAKAVREIFG